VETDWNADNWEKRIAQSMAKYLVSLRTANDNRTRWLIAAILLEIVGIAATAVVALLIVQHVG
jgi:predicted membrane protein